MHCNTCNKPIQVPINSEMICFACYNERMKTRPMRGASKTTRSDSRQSAS